MGDTARSLLFFAIAVSLILIEVAICAGAVVDGRADDYLMKSWTTKDGLPQNTVTSIVQTRDGYIWLGTFGGLARFNGISFTVFDSANTPQFTSNRVLSLFEDSHGTLWIGAETGEIYTIRGLDLREFKPTLASRRYAVWGFQEDNAGNIFAASDTGLERFAVDTEGRYIEGSYKELSTGTTYEITRDQNGKIWAKVSGEIYSIDCDQLIPAASQGIDLPDKMLKMRFAPDGRILAGAMASMGIVGSGRYREILPLQYAVHRSGFSLAVFGDKMLFQQAGELYVINDDSTLRYDVSGYCKAGTRAMLMDDEENLWLATQEDGLVRMTRRKIRLVGDMAGPDVNGVYSMVQGPDGTVWLSGRHLMRVRNDQVAQVGDATSPEIRALAFDRSGALWGGGPLGVYRIVGDNYLPVSQFAGMHVHALFFDDTGDLWVGTSKGLYRLRDDEVTKYTIADGLVDDSVHFITQLRDRTIWIGTFRGVSKFREGKFENLTTDNGLSGGYVRDVVEDDDGTIWLATYGGGIDRLKNGKITAIRTNEGLPNNFISRILVDDQNKYWILSNLGIYAVERDELVSVADGKRSFLAGAVFGDNDGMPSSEGNGGHQPAGIKTSDGRLWFPMLRDVVIIDPSTISVVPPKVVIEYAMPVADSEPAEGLSPLFDPRVPLEVRDGQRNVQITYSGLSFTKPEETRFFYRMRGLDKDWVDAGNRRTAFYPYLPAGNYAFEVKALNSNGVWSEKVATLTVAVAQRFWESQWFLLVVIAIGLSILGYIYWSWSNKHLEDQRKQREFSRRLIDAHESERQRIATDLHDGLGQNLLLIRNWSLMAVSDKMAPEEVGGYVAKISETAAESLDEARAIVRDLSPRSVRRFGLTEAIINSVDHLEDASGVAFERKIENIDELFNEDSEISIFRIVQECLTNIVKHSESARGVVEIGRSNGKVTIAVEDFGRGFSTSLLNKKNGGIGLQSMGERASYLGGRLSIRSSPGKGTRVVVELNVN